MVRSNINSVLEYIRGAAGAEALGALPDRELLQRFVGSHEEAAFAVLMCRHGPMVLGVCRRVLRQSQDAEDAFQATFLLLARGAAAIRKPDSVGGWLHGVALRAATKLRAKATRQPATEAPRPDAPPAAAGPAASDPIDEVTWKELRAVLDEELDRLPPELRVPLVLCYLEGRTQDEGACQLGWTQRTFRRRLEKGRARLARLLERRGVTLSMALLAVMVSQDASAVAAALWAPVLRAAATLAGERAGAVSAEAWRLADGLVPSHVASKGKLLLALLLTANLAAAAVGLPLLGRSAQRPPDPPEPSSAQSTQAEAAPAGVEVVGTTAVLSGRVRDASGRPVARAKLVALAQRPYQPGEHGLRQEILGRGAADAEGRFRLEVPAGFPTWYAERQVVVMASAPGHGPGTLAVTLRAGQPNLALNLAAHRPLSGRLTDATGQPVAGVRLEVVRLGSALRDIVQAEGPARAGEGANFWPAPATTNARGEFELPGLGTVRNVWLQIHDDRFAVETFPAEFSDGRPIDGHPYGIGVVPGQVFEGTVTAADTGRPIPHARLTAVSPNEWTDAPRYALHTFAQEATSRAACAEFDARADADGRFRLRLPSGRYFSLEAHAPPGSPHLPVRRVIDRQADDVGHLNFALPRGVLLTARVRGAADGRPVAGAVVYYLPDEPRVPAGASPLHGCDAHATTGTDGRVRLAVMPGRGKLCVHAPDGNFLALPYRVSGGAAGRVGYAHGIEPLNLSAENESAEVDVSLRAGVAITGKVVGPGGRPVTAAVLVSARHVHPLNPATARPIPTVGADFVLPGCESGRAYRVLFLDAERKWGAAVDLTAGAPPEVVRLQPCGQATVRFVDADGRPQANRTVTPFALLEPDIAVGDDAALARRAADAVPHEIAWADPLAYRHSLGPHTEADGRITLTGLVPGVRYGLIQWDGARGRRAAGPFTVRPGETLRLPDVTALPARASETDRP